MPSAFLVCDEWKIECDQFTGDSISSPIYSSESYQFQFYLFASPSNSTKPLVLSLSILSKIYKYVGIDSILIVPPSSSLSIVGLFSDETHFLSIETSLTLDFIRRQTEPLTIPIVIASMPYTYINRPKLLSFTNPLSIISSILSPFISQPQDVISKQSQSWLCEASVHAFLDDPPIIKLEAPIILIGDLHGKFFDLIRIFLRFGFPNQTKYLLLGDLVDRGDESVRLLTLIMAFKVLFPSNIFVIRGNHECESTSSAYGFSDECKLRKKKFSEYVKVFDCLPFAATIGEQIFCVHGGISPDLRSLSCIQSIKRPIDLDSSKLLEDLTWSDPTPTPGFYSISQRGCGYGFGPLAVERFLDDFGFELVVRAHEVVQMGYKFEFGLEGRLLTLFSATDQVESNNGAAMVVDKQMNYTFGVFEPPSHAELDDLSRRDFNIDFGKLL